MNEYKLKFPEEITQAELKELFDSLMFWRDQACTALKYTVDSLPIVGLDNGLKGLFATPEEWERFKKDKATEYKATNDMVLQFKKEFEESQV